MQRNDNTLHLLEVDAAMEQSRTRETSLMLVLSVSNHGAHTSSVATKSDHQLITQDDIRSGGYINAPVLGIRNLGVGQPAKTQLFEPVMRHALQVDSVSPGTTRTLYMYHLDGLNGLDVPPNTWGAKFWCRCRPVPAECELYLVNEEGSYARWESMSKSATAEVSMVIDHPEDVSNESFKQVSFTQRSVTDSATRTRCSSQLQWIRISREGAIGAHSDLPKPPLSRAARRLLGAAQSPLPHLLPVWRPSRAQPGSSSFIAEKIEVFARSLKPIAPAQQESSQGSKRRHSEADAGLGEPILVTLQKPSHMAKLGINLATGITDRAVVLSVTAGYPASELEESTAKPLIEANDTILAVGGAVCTSLIHAVQLFREAPAGPLEILKTAPSCRPLSSSRPAYRSDYPWLQELPPEVARWTMLPPEPAIGGAPRSEPQSAESPPDHAYACTPPTHGDGTR